MSNGKVLRYTDPRRFGARLWTKELEGHNVLAHLDRSRLVTISTVSTCIRSARRKKRRLNRG